MSRAICSGDQAAWRVPGDIVVCLGAGNSTEWAHALPEWLAEAPKRAGSASVMFEDITADLRAIMPELRGRLDRQCAACRYHLVSRRRTGAGAVHAGR